jgi:hypothetical protein
MMFSVMTILAKKLKVIEVKCYVWVIDVIRCDVLLVMYDLTWVVTSFAQTMSMSKVRSSTIFPCFGLIKLLSIRFNDSHPKIKSTS